MCIERGRCVEIAAPILEVVDLRQLGAGEHDDDAGHAGQHGEGDERQAENHRHHEVIDEDELHGRDDGHIHRRDEIYQLIREQLDAGRQAYIIYPLVEGSEKIDLKSATEMADQAPGLAVRIVADGRFGGGDSKDDHETARELRRLGLSGRRLQDRLGERLKARWETDGLTFD